MSLTRKFGLNGDQIVFKRADMDMLISEREVSILRRTFGKIRSGT